MPTQAELIKHWPAVKAFKKGKTIRGRPLGGKWIEITPEFNSVPFYSDWEFEVAPDPEPTPMTVNWDHVHPDCNAIAKDFSGAIWGYDRIPARNGPIWNQDRCRTFHVSILASLDPGTCHWKDSLIIRPGYEEGK
jgi:hypothetical protein